MSAALSIGTVVEFPAGRILTRHRKGRVREWRHTSSSQTPTVGVIVRHITLANGTATPGMHDWETGIFEPTVWRAKEHKDAYLVALGSRTNPLRVLREDVTPTDQPAPDGLGTPVTFNDSDVLVRTQTWAGGPQDPLKQSWTPTGGDPVEQTGVLAGYRTIYDTSWTRRLGPDDDRRIIDATHRVALIVRNPRHKPVYIPADRVQP